LTLVSPRTFRSISRRRIDGVISTERNVPLTVSSMITTIPPGDNSVLVRSHFPLLVHSSEDDASEILSITLSKTRQENVKRAHDLQCREKASGQKPIMPKEENAAEYLSCSLFLCGFTGIFRRRMCYYSRFLSR